MVWPEITIGAPVRNRAWILRHYLDHLVSLDYPKDKIRFLFILNDSTDRSDEVLRDFKQEYKELYAGIEISVYNQHAPEDERTWRREKIYHTLANVRNKLLEQIETPYFFSVDTDILVPPNALKVLVESNKDIVAGVIRNDYIIQPDAEYPNQLTNLLIMKNGTIRHYMKYPLNDLFQVDVTGAIYLLKKEVCEQVRYGFDPQGEDVYFCLQAKEKGFEIWANSNVYAQHVMIVYQKECSDCGRPCKAIYIQDNKIYPKLKKCPHKISKIVRTQPNKDQKEE
jgi:GT2 family glycosyltransferase